MQWCICKMQRKGQPQSTGHSVLHHNGWWISKIAKKGYIAAQQITDRPNNRKSIKARVYKPRKPVERRQAIQQVDSAPNQPPTACLARTTAGSARTHGGDHTGRKDSPPPKMTCSLHWQFRGRDQREQRRTPRRLGAATTSNEESRETNPRRTENVVRIAAISQSLAGSLCKYSVRTSET